MHDDALIEALRRLDAPAEPAPEFRRRLRALVVSESRGPVHRIDPGALRHRLPPDGPSTARPTSRRARRFTGWAVAAAAFVVVVAAGFLTVWLTRGHDESAVSSELAIPPGRLPNAAASDGERLWVLAAHGDPGPAGLPWMEATLYAVDPKTGDVTEVQRLTDRPTLVAATGAGVWVTHFQTGAVTRIDPASGEIVATITLELPFDVGAGPDRRRFLPNDIVVAHGSVWVSTARGAVARIDVATNSVVDMFVLSPQGPQQLTVGPNGVWVAEDVHGVTHIDADTGGVSTLRVRVADSTEGTLNHTVGQVSFVDGQLYVTGVRPPSTTDRPRIVSHIDPETMQVVRTASITEGASVFLGWVDGAFGALDATGTFRGVVAGPDLLGEPYATNWDPGRPIIQVEYQAWMLHPGEPRMSRLTVTGTTPARARPSFVPATRVESEQTVLPLTFPDGSRAELRYPARLDLVSHGLRPYSSGYLPGVGRDFDIHFGSVDDVLSRFTAQRLGEYQTAEDETVGFYRLAEYEGIGINHLVFGFDTWTVLVYDYRGVSAMSDEQRATWAHAFHGRTDEDGFLILSAEPPLRLAAAGEHAGPELSFAGESGGLTLFVGPCEPYEDPQADQSSGFFSWCDPEAAMVVHAQGEVEFIQTMLDELEIRRP